MKPPRAWLFGIAAMPYGSFSGVVAIALPYLLRKSGMAVEGIASVEALVQAPSIWYVLWAPVVDIKFRRRTWIVLLSVASGVSTAAALVLTMQASFRAATVLFVVASAINQPVSSALGGLAAVVMPDDRRGRAAGWSQAGIVSAGVATGALAVWLGDGAAASVVPLVVGTLIVAPSLAALAVAEPLPQRSSRLARIRRVRDDLLAAVKRRDVWLGIAFFLSPVGAGALINLFSGVAADYHASSSAIIGVAALGGAMVVCGALAGGAMLDRIDRWLAYPVVGLLTGASVVAMCFAPLTPLTYLIDAVVYALLTGFAYAAFMALALELVGSKTHAGGTLFTLFTAAVNAPVVYMLRLDGVGHAHFGVRGMLAFDGIANGLFGIILLIMLRRFRSRL